ncbi:MAG: ABC transporter ATP-binding protein [Nitrospinae bacterium]|nr:ABC transporter ATP-binding protein [Nitrospinota bacterium]
MNAPSAESSVLDSAAQTLMQISDATFAYAEQPVLSGISFELRTGEILGVIGPNGSGKSTLLKLMGGILAPDSGSVAFKGKDLGSFKRRALAQSVSWIPQEHPMVFPFKVSEIVLMGRHPYLSPWAFEGEEDFRIARQAMELTETLQFAERGFNEISGGEKQRVMIAGAIAQEPELMLLDEPTASLDMKYQMEILDILKKLNHAKRLTLALSIHDLHLASKFCDRVVLLKNGRIVKDASPEEAFQKEILETVYEVKVKIFRDHDDGSVLISPEL